MMIRHHHHHQVKKKKKKKKKVSSSKEDEEDPPLSGEWMFSSKVFAAKPEDLSTHTSLMDLSEINTLISQPKLTKSMPHKRSPSVYSSSSSPSSTLRLLKQIRMRLDGEDFRKHQRKEVPYDKEAEAKMASDLHMTVEELEQFEELSENVQTDQKKYMEIFEKFDADQSGTLSDSELRNALNAIGENMSEQELQELKQKTDGNGDGHFDYHEFVDLLNARKRIAALASSMLRSSTTTSDFQRHTVKRRAPPQLPRLRVPTDLQSRRNMRSVDAFLPRPTPKILKPGRKQKIKVSEMKRQLEISKRALQDSDEHIKRNLEWIRGHCPVTNIRAQLFMQKWGVQKLERIMTRALNAHMHRAIVRWKTSVEFEKCQEKAEQFLKLRGSRILMHVVRGHEFARMRTCFEMWCDEISRQVEREQFLAAVEIQRRARGFLVRLRAYRRKLEKSAKMIQRHYRGRLGWKRVVRRREEIHLNGAAVDIQRSFRALLGRREFARVLRDKHEKEASIILQASSRRLLAKKRVRALREERHQNRCATTIQGVFRSRAARVEVAKRKERKQQRDAAVQIQTIFRGRLGRNQTKILRQNKRQNDAATALQCLHRRREARKELKTRKERRVREEKSAMAVQRLIRGVQARQRVGIMYVQNSAAMSIQLAFRIRRAKQKTGKLRDLRRIKQSIAAKKIQAMERGRLCRRRIKMDSASRVVQRTFRRHHRHVEHQRKRRERLISALRIQAWYRGCRGRFSAHVKLRALQEKRREKHRRDAEEALKRKRRQEQEHAAIRIQTHMRMHRSHNLVNEIRKRRREHLEQEQREREQLKLEHASIVLQRQIRRYRARKILRSKRKEHEEKLKELEEKRSEEELAKIREAHEQEITALKLQNELQDLLNTRIEEEEKRKKREEIEAARQIALQAKRKHSAVLIQRVWRGHRDKKKCKAMLLEHRGRKSVEDAKAREEARRVRLMMVKKAEEKAKEEKRKLEEMKREKASMILQCSWRSRQAREEIQRKRNEIERKKQEHLEMERSATKLQCAFRGLKARRIHDDKKKLHEEELKRAREREAAEEEIRRLKRKQRRELAALKLQSAMRAKWARRDAAEKARRHAAAKREFLKRKQENDAAVKIQAMFKSYRDRRMLKQMKRRIKNQRRKMIEEQAEAEMRRDEFVSSETGVGGGAQEEWIEYYDEASGYPYYFNPRTQETRWENPTASGYESSYTAGTATDYDTDNWDSTQETYGSQSYDTSYSSYDASYGAGGGGGYQQQQESSEWVESYDTVSGQKYWYNPTTGESQWAS